MANIIRVGGGGTGGGSKIKKMAIEKLTEGTIVRIKEKGVETDYYLAQHDYQPSLNGSGRVLFARVKGGTPIMSWSTAGVNAYARSTIDDFLNIDWFSRYDADVREAMGETIFPYTAGNGITSVTTYQRSIFLLSVTEMGYSNSRANVEGTAVPIAETLKTIILDDGTTNEGTWLRTPSTTGTSDVFWAPNIQRTASYVASTAKTSFRPCFTLPNTATVLQEPNLDGSYTLSLSDDDPSKEYFKLTVVDGTEQPTDVVDNTIWVNTDVDIGMVYLAPNAPENPEVGDVWVNTTNKYNPNGTNASTNILRVNDNPYLEVNVLNISQWDGSDWVLRDGSAIYANGGWSTMALWIFNYGTQNESYPWKFGGKVSSPGALIDSCLTDISYGTDNIAARNIYDADNYNSYGMLMTSVPVNVTNYNKYSFTVRRSGTSAPAYAGLSNISNPAINTISHQYWTQSGNGTSIVTTDVDISSLTGEFYPCFRVYAGGGYIYYLHVYMVCFTA